MDNPIEDQKENQHKKVKKTEEKNSWTIEEKDNNEKKEKIFIATSKGDVGHNIHKSRM